MVCAVRQIGILQSIGPKGGGRLSEKPMRHKNQPIILDTISRMMGW